MFCLCFSVIQKVDYVFAENGLVAYRNGQLESIQVSIIYLGTVYVGASLSISGARLTSHHVTTGKKVYFVCMLSTVHTGPHGRRTTTRVY